MEKVRLTGERATLLITLYAKAEESRLPGSLLQDHYAAEAVARLDHDFSALGMRPDEMIGLAMRAYSLDAWARAFIAAHRGATVLHLGCGLDSRVYRVAPPPEVNWFDVDYPDVIDLRRALYPPRPGYQMLGSSMADLGWLSQIPTDRPALVVAEGLFLYLSEDQVLQLLRTVTTQFPSGEVVFDAYSRMGLALAARNRMFRATGAVMRWSLDNPLDLESQVPGLRLCDEQWVYEESGGRQWARYTWPARAAIWLMRRVAPLRRLGRLLRYRF
ncbi:MAG TPA: class I SAM-dependent methyltransferase [Achromobacter sp.]|uniref:class I SAM-dependent methyltransferase n=1 Tax=unclassified Achromobacter TaxID=2626865 RepID=UPI000CFB95C0|nr:class I SAM-dependent methyltransferase [Achromobacter sp. MYb9]PQZ64720.1 methyltransferase [Achromobacter sp. MYb9]